MISLDCHEQNTPQNHKKSNPQVVAQLLQFRHELKNSLTHRPDAIMKLLDAISSNTDAISVAQLSLNPCFGYQYPSVYDGIDSFFTARNPQNSPQSTECGSGATGKRPPIDAVDSPLSASTKAT